MSHPSEFLLTTGRALTQLSLYTSDHPSVKKAVVESHQLLSVVLDDNEEISLSIHENVLLINGKSIENLPEAASRPFILLLKNFDLHSLSFTRGITQQEMTPFFSLATKNDLKKLGTDLGTFFNQQNVGHIKVNHAKYAKIGEDQKIGGNNSAQIGAGKDSLFEQLENLNLDDLIRALVEKAVPQAQDQSKIATRVRDLIREELIQKIDQATKEIRKEKERVESQHERTQEVVGSMSEGVVVVDEAGNVLMMNPVAEEIYGVKLGECLGKPLWQGVREEQMIALAKDLASPTDRPVVKEVQLHAAQQTKKTLRASSATVQDMNGHVVGLVSVLSDVTKQKELTRLQNEFMANVTHDLRTPIHALKLAVGAILEGAAGPVSNEQEKMLTLANKNVERLARLIDDLLDFSQIESGSMQIKPQVIDLVPYLKEAVAGLESWSKSRNVSLSFTDPGALPNVYADSDRILQVVINLISNAIKFTPMGGQVTVRAKVIKEKVRSAIQIEIEDTGKGISKEDQQRIFERFVQLKNQEKLDIRGTGLGLAICKGLVDLHRGQLGLQSPVSGKIAGTLFYFTIPVLDKAPSQSSQQINAPAPTPVPKKKGFWKNVFSRFKVLLFIFLCAQTVHARPYWGTVRRVLSGDLVQLSDGSQVHYLGITSPTLENDYHQESIEANRSWVENKEVRLVYGLQEMDLDGNWFAYVFVDGVLVNQELVRQGLALVVPVSADEEYLKDLLSAEKEAQRKKRGVWKDSKIEPYSARIQKKQNMPWATSDEIKKGIKK